MDANDELAMVVADDDRDFVPFDETTLDKETEFMKFCHESFRRQKEYWDCPDWGNVYFEEWRTCIAMMVLVGGTDLQDHLALLDNLEIDSSLVNDRKRITRVVLCQWSTVESCRGQLLEEKFCPLKCLESLSIGYGTEMDPNPILKMLTSFDFCTKERLKKLSLECAPLNANNVETLFFQVVPRFPNLTTLDLRYKTASNANAFEAIANRIQREGSSDVSTSLRCVTFSNDFESGLQHVKRVSRILLQHFASIDDIDFPGSGTFVMLTKDELAFPLVKNIVGWRRLEGKEIPLAIWPLLLRRARIKLERYPNYRHYTTYTIKPRLEAAGIYYLLREGSALIGRRDLGSRRSSKRKYGEV